MWSGVHLVHMSKTRDTNSHIENWFRLIKNNIFNGDRMRPKDFISKLYSEVSSRIKERRVALNREISRNTFKIPKKLKKITRTNKHSSNFVQENWSKRASSCNTLKKKSIYYNSPAVLSQPQKFYHHLNSTFYHSMHHDHNYFKNAKRLKSFYNLDKLYTDTMNKNNKAKINIINNILITGQGIKTLEGSRWLDDQVINTYFQLICNFSDLNIFFVDSGVYKLFKERLNSKQQYCLKKSKCSIDDLDIILLPINFTDETGLIGHWAFAAVYVNAKVIKFYDSIKNFGLSLNGHCVCEDIRRFLRSTNFFSNIAACQWQLEYPETPQQQDTSSCGVFACQIAKQLSNSQSLNIKTGDIPYLRKEMTCEIALGILFK